MGREEKEKEASTTLASYPSPRTHFVFSGVAMTAKKIKGPDDDLIDAAAAAVKKKFKDVPVGTAADELKYPTLWISTGSYALDRVCRGRNPGGIPIGPLGCIVHLAGDWSTGKSLILDHLFKSAQEVGGFALCSETEGSRNPHFAQALGVDLRRLYIMRPPTIEEAIDMGIDYHNHLRKKDKDTPFLWGIDSLDSMESDKTAGVGLSEGGGWRYGGGRSEAFAAGLRKIAHLCARYPTTLVMLNQTRDVIGSFAGPKKRTPGGNPPHFYASLEIMLSAGRKGETRGKYEGAKMTAEQKKKLGMRVTDQGEVIGRWIKGRISKSKVSQTWKQEAEFYIDFGKGVHRWAGLLQRLLQEGKVDLVKENIKHAEQVFADEKEWLIWLAQNKTVLQ